MFAETIPNSGKLYIFRPRYERAYFVVLAFFLAIAAAASFDLFKMPSFKDRWVQLAVIFLLFSYLHTLLTFLGIIFVPELRAWFRELLKPRRLAVFAFIVGVIFYTSWEGLRSLDKQEMSGAVLSSIFMLLISAHNLGQTKGLSLMYNRYLRPRLSELEMAKQLKVERVERWIFNVLLAKIAFIAIALPVLRNHMQYIWGLHLLFIILSLALVINSLRYPQLFKTNKFYYLQSIWLYALVPLMPGALVLQMGLHGVEYVMLGDVVLRRSKMRLTKRWLYLAVFILVFFSLLKGFDAKLFSGNDGALDRRFTSALVILFVFLEYLHYYVDSLMFRFKDPYVRENIAPLFGSGETA